MVNGYANDNGLQQSPLPRLDSVYNIITRRIRAAHTMFGANVKLVLRQDGSDHWSKLPLPYLLVVPTLNRAPREIDLDSMTFVIPRSVAMIAQFDARGSEMEHLAANDIDTAEYQLIQVLGNWTPLQHYKMTLYGGMRIQATREPDVKVVYNFIFNELVMMADEPLFVEEPALAELEGIHVNLLDPTCVACAGEAELGPAPPISVTGGGCPCPPEPDPCEPPCEPENAITQAKQG